MAYPNGGAPKSALVQYGGSWFFEDVARRVKWVVDTYHANRTGPGNYIKVTQGYRFRGEPSDIPLGQKPEAKDESNADQTTTGDANQSYEWGRDLAGFTSASPIGTSAHGANPGDSPWGGAVDMDADDVDYRTSLFAQVGMTRTAMPTESWHYAVSGPSSVALPELEDEDDMPLNDADKQWISEAISNGVNNLFRLTPAPGEAALNVSQINKDALGAFQITLDDGTAQALGPVLNDIFQQGRRTLQSVQLIAAKAGVDLTSIE